MVHNLKYILSLVFVGVFFLGGSYLYAEWTAPPEGPPDGNVSAPIHTGPEEQEKEGDLVANLLEAIEDVVAGDAVEAGNQMRSNEYCDLSGGNCFKAEDVSQGGSSADRTWSSESRMARQGYRNDTGSDMVLILGTPRDWTGWRPRVSADGNNWRGVGVSGTRHSRVSNTFVVPDGHWFAYSDSNSNITTSFQACEGYWCNPTWGWHELRANNNVHNAD